MKNLSCITLIIIGFSAPLWASYKEAFEKKDYDSAINEIRPLAFDNAMSAESARVKGIKAPYQATLTSWWCRTWFRATSWAMILNTWPEPRWPVSS